MGGCEETLGITVISMTFSTVISMNKENGWKFNTHNESLGGKGGYKGKLEATTLPAFV